MIWQIKDRVSFLQQPATVTGYSYHATKNEIQYILHLDDGTRIVARAHELELPPPKEKTVNEPQTTPTPNNNTYMRAAVTAALNLARTQETLTADDIQDSLSKASGPVSTAASALNQVVRELAANGVLEATTDMKRSTRTGGPIKVWRSKLFVSNAEQAAARISIVAVANAFVSSLNKAETDIAVEAVAAAVAAARKK